LPAETGSACIEAGLLTDVVEFGLVQVRHGADGTAASLEYMSTDASDFDIGSLRDQLKLLADYL
jgi:hypothetical protein